VRSSKFLVVTFIAATAAYSAQAQQIGTYTGMMQDGSSVTIVVAQDPNNANLEVYSIGFGVTDTCEKTKETLSYVGVGLGDGHDIASDGSFSFASSNYFDVNLVASMTFKGNKSVKGKGGANLAAFNPAYGHDNLTDKTQACVSPRQPFSATFSGADISHALPAGTVMIRSLGDTASVRRPH